MWQVEESRQKLFNCIKTDFSKRTYITAEEKALPGHKLIKDRITFFFCTNARDNLKNKPLLVYSSDYPLAFKKCNVQKTTSFSLWSARTPRGFWKYLWADCVLERDSEVFKPAREPPTSGEIVSLE